MIGNLPPTQGVFTRASSGLVRQVGTLDTFVYSFLQVSLGFMIFTVAVWPLYPGASMEWATLITIVGVLALGITYALMSAAYSRSGGEYVFVSRTIHPAVGFAVSFMVAFWQAYYAGLSGAFMALFGLAPLFQMLGVQIHSTGMTSLGDWFASGWGMFLTALTLIAGFSYLQHLGMRIYFKYQRWLTVPAVISVIATLVVLLLGKIGTLDFPSHLDSLLGSGTFRSVIDQGRAAGVDLSVGTSLTPTLNFVIWPAFLLIFSILSVSFSGEIRNVKKAQLIGISGAVIVGGFIMIALGFLGRGTTGDEFLRATAYSKPLAISASYLNVIASVAANNVFVTVLVNLWVILFIAYVVPVPALYAQRALLAWGIDGVAPEKLAKVSEKHHSPTWAIVVTAVAATSAAALFAFTHLISFLSGLLGFSAAFLVAAIAGTLFPFIKKDAYEGSPAAMKFAGVPVITLVGLVATVWVGFLFYRAAVDDTFGASTTFSIKMTTAVAVFALVYFYVARWVRKSQGVDIDRRFKEIPIE